MQVNRAGLPPEIKQNKKQSKGTIQSFRSGNLLTVSWMDKRKVVMLSSKHCMATTQITSRLSITV